MTEHLTCPVHTFSRPLAALEVLPRLNVGVVATDFYMPGLNGLEFISKARVLVPHCPFLIITGHGAELASRSYTHLPEIKEILKKPFKWRVLAEAVIRHWPDTQIPQIREINGAI